MSRGHPQAGLIHMRDGHLENTIVGGDASCRGRASTPRRIANGRSAITALVGRYADGGAEGPGMRRGRGGL